MTNELLVVTSCTARKMPVLAGTSCSAEALYTGQQHLRLMRGVDAYRRAGEPAGSLRFQILSALYGLLPSERKVESYDHTFSGQRVADIRRDARERGVPDAIRRALARPFAAGVLLLGDPYLRACDLDEHVKLGGPLISFCSPAAARRLPRVTGLRVVTLSNAEARRFSVGMIALKGELGQRMLTRLATTPDDMVPLTAPETDILEWLEADVRTQQFELSQQAA